MQQVFQLPAFPVSAKWICSIGDCIIQFLTENIEMQSDSIVAHGISLCDYFDTQLGIIFNLFFFLKVSLWDHHAVCV
jgi:hypothetical protein